MMYFAVFIICLSKAFSEIVYEENRNKHLVNLQTNDLNVKVQENINLNRDFSEVHSEEYNDINEGVAVDGIQGIPGKDYPVYSEIPHTSFSCIGKTQPGYYADEEADCQVFHICLTGGHKTSFLCPNGSLFNQMYLVCDWWYEVNCDSTNGYIESLKDILRINSEIYTDYSDDNENNNNYFIHLENDDLHIQSSGENLHPTNIPTYNKNNLDFTHVDSSNVLPGKDNNNKEIKYSENNQYDGRGHGKGRVNLHNLRNKNGSTVHENFDDQNYKNDTHLNFVHLLNNNRVLSSSRINNRNNLYTDKDMFVDANDGSHYDDSKRDNQINSFNLLHNRGDVSDLRNSQNEAYYGGTVQNTFNKKYQTNRIISETLS